MQHGIHSPKPRIYLYALSPLLIEIIRLVLSFFSSAFQDNALAI